MLLSQKTEDHTLQNSCTLQRSLAKSSQIFSTSPSFYYSPIIERAIHNKSSKLTSLIEDERCDRQQQHLARCNTSDESKLALRELTQYYKFYTQTTIVYLPEFFRIMDENRERKKAVDYNRLKKLLDLSDSTGKSELHTKHSYPLPSFHLISRLNNTIKSEETLLFVALKDKLNNALGYKHYRSIEQIDRDYYFQNIGISNEKHHHFQNFSRKRKYFLATEEKQQKIVIPGVRAKKSRRNNSCKNLEPKQIQAQPRVLIKKKHQSMDNVTELKYEAGSPLKKKADWLSKFKQNNAGPVKQSKGSAKQTRTKYTESDEEQFRQAIRGVKEKIRREKGCLKKKSTGFSNQSQLTAASKKSTLAATHGNKISTGSKVGPFRFF